MKSIILIVLLLILLLCLPLTFAQNSSLEIESLVKATGSFLDELNEYDEVSLAIIITKDQVPVLKKVYGLANRSFGVPNRIDTKFNIASMNKMFTATAVVQLIQQGKLHFEDKIGELMPNYPNEEVRSKVTVYQLLTHTAGMGNIFGSRYSQIPVNRYQHVDDYLPLFVDDSLCFEPGSVR